MIQSLKRFFTHPAIGGILLALMAALALVFKNSPISAWYAGFLNTPVQVHINAFIIDKPLFLWINDGLMALFFLMVGLEVKREVICGHLSDRATIAFPAFAALGGLAFPALIYYFFNFNDPVFISGWAIPAATDIAFAMGVIALLGKGIPQTVKLTLLTIAILDDIAAILIIALFYTSNLSVFSLTVASVVVLGLFTINRLGVKRIGPYMFLGALLWACVLKSGVHATMSGVVLAMFIPLDKQDYKNSPAYKVESALHEWVTYLILPLFAFANAGVPLANLGAEQLLHPVSIGIILGLVVGKPVGILIVTRLATIFRLAKLPHETNWKHITGIGCLAGIGFTMSLFIGTLAFEADQAQDMVRISVLLASIIAGSIGYTILRMVSHRASDGSLKATT